MAGHKLDRTSEDIKREISLIIRELKDPRVAGKMLSVVHAEVSGDLSYAKVNISAIEGIEAAREAVKGLKSASGFIRRELGSRLSIRKIPELRFIADDSIAYGAKISQTLTHLGLETTEQEDNDDNDHTDS